MSHPYLDTSVVVKLIVAEPLSARVQSFLQKRLAVVPYTKLIAIETVNTLHAKVFRKEMTRRQLRACEELIADFLREGRFFQPALSMEAVFAESMKRLPAITGATGCRTLDLMHVASAQWLGFQEFASTDKRQLRAAHAAGLTPLDLGSL